MNWKNDLAQAREGVMRGLMEKTPNLPSRTLARILFKEHPKLFINLEAARSAVNLRRGCGGGEARRRIKGWDEYYRIPGTSYTLPRPIAIANSQPFILDCQRALLIGDLHIPFHDPDAIGIALKEGRRHKIDTILIGGDLCDCYAWSVFCRTPMPDVSRTEVEQTHQFFLTLRRMFSKVRIIWLWGNHEERFDMRIFEKLPELAALAQKRGEIQLLEDAMAVKKYRVEVVKNRRIIYMGKLSIIHGQEMGRASDPVNPARTLQLRCRDITAVFHFHTSSQDMQKTIRDKHIATWSIGCLCNCKPFYRPINRWNLGYALYTRTSSDGNFVLDNKRIIHRMIV